jgi:hypothetical protein
VARVGELTETDIRQLILTMPFRKFAQLGFLKYDRDVSRLRVASALWGQIQDEASLQQIRALAETALSAYYQRLGTRAGPESKQP